MFYGQSSRRHRWRQRWRHHWHQRWAVPGWRIGATAISATTLRAAIAGFLATSANIISSANVAAAEKPRNAPASVTILAVDSAAGSGILTTLLTRYLGKSQNRFTIVSGSAAAMAAAARAGKGHILLLDDHALHTRLSQEKVVGKVRDIMYGELLIVGPKSDPADINGMVSVVDAFRAISQAEAPFTSRGDGSGVHRVEQAVWLELALNPAPSRSPWFTVTRAPMAKTLAVAAARKSYVLTDQASWLRLKNRQGLSVHVSQDPRTMLRFSVSPILKTDPKAASGKQAAELGAMAKRFVTWLSQKKAQGVIKLFEIDKILPFHPQFGLAEE